MLPTISLFSVAFSLFFACLFYFAYKFYLKPYLSLLYYKKQGGATQFNWKMTSYFDGFRNAEEKGDYFDDYKQLLKKNPQAKFIAENFGPYTTLILVDPEMIKEFLRKYETYYKNERLFSLFIDQAKGSTVFAEGKEWKRQRKVISAAFNFEFLKHVVPLVISTGQKHFQGWTKEMESTQVDLIERFGMLTGELTGNFFFGKTFSDQKIEGIPVATFLQHLTNDTMLELMEITTLVCGPRLFRANILPKHKKMNRRTMLLREKFGEMIKETEMSQKKENNLLTSLLELQKGERQNEGISTDEIIGEFIGLFAAGTDTTSHLLSCALYFLSKNPHIFTKVKEEIDSVFSDLDKIDIESINKMDYTLAFLKEVLRLGGPVATLFDRIALEDDILCGVKVKKGDMFNFCNDLFFTSERYYSNPKEIIPERWFSDEFSQDRFRSEPYAFTPFSAGPRNCVGQHLAIIEAKLLLGLFLKTFEFSFPKDYKFVLVQRFTYEPLYPLLATLKRKEKA